MLANVQYSIAEKDFSNGAIDSGTLSSEKSRQSDAQEKFENSKFELSKSLMILELVHPHSHFKKQINIHLWNTSFISADSYIVSVGGYLLEQPL